MVARRTGSNGSRARSGVGGRVILEKNRWRPLLSTPSPAYTARTCYPQTPMAGHHPSCHVSCYPCWLTQARAMAALSPPAILNIGGG